MVEFECPFCHDACRVDAAAFVADGWFRCDGCRIEFHVDPSSETEEIAQAA
jgi:hypothetical protein